MCPCKYIYGGLFKSNGEWIHPQRTVDSHELIFVTRGEVYIEEDGREFHLTENDCLHLEAGRRHGGTRKSEHTEFYWLHFTGELPFKLLRVDAGIRVLLRQLLHYANAPQYPPLGCELVFALICMELETTYQMSQNGQAAALPAEIREWIRANSDRKLTVAQVAAQFRYNSDYLGRIFKQAYGTTLQSYIVEQRCCYLESLLLSGAYTMNEIAALAGFENYQQFLKYFTYHEGMAPTAFKNAYFATHINNR